MLRVRQAVRIDEMRLGEAERMRRLVHVVGESFDRARNPFRDHDGHIVRGFYHQHFQGIVERHQRARPETLLDGGAPPRAENGSGVSSAMW